MSTIYDCQVATQLLAGTRLGRAAIARGELAVIPTDTVYGIAADAFSPRAVQRLLDAKGRTRQSPPPVLIPDLATLDALAEYVPPVVRTLVERFWPGGLTVVLPARRSLSWDLGETGGTVALRMPDNGIALEFLAETGPLAVSSANLHGRPAATTAQEAFEQLGDSIAVYLDGGPSRSPGDELARAGSTIIDATNLADASQPLTILRHGVISDEVLLAVVESLRPADPAD